MYELCAPNSKLTVRPGNIVKLNRFADESWIVNLGWFSCAGNRPINGWYLVSAINKDRVKPLNLSDLDDIYVIEQGEVREDYKELDPEIKKLIHDLKLQVEELSREVAQLTAEVEAKDEVIAQKGQEILALQKQINDLTAEIAALEAQHNLDVETIETLNSQVRAQAEIIAEKAAEIRTLTARVAELAEENELLTQQHQEDLATIAQQSATIQEQAESIATLTTENEALSDENDRLTDENAELVTQHQEDTATIAEQAQTIETKDEQISGLNSQVTTLTVENQEKEETITRQNTTIDQLNSRVPALQQLDPINPSGIQQTYNPESPNIGFPQVIVNPVTAEGTGFRADYYKEGEPYLNEVGTYNPFPENSYGGIYYTELGEGGYPKKILIKDMLRSASTILQFFNTSNDAKRELREIVFENCPGFLTTANGIFQRFAYLIKVILPNSLTSIGQSAFQTCTSLAEINFPNSLTSIGGSAFQDCTSLTELSFPNSLTSIGGSAFQTCTSLAEVNLPNSLTSIGGYAFYNCTSLINLTLAQGFNCNGLNVSASTHYSVETIVSCLEALADRTGQTAYTITFGTTNLNKLTAEQKAIAINKNWNLT